MSQLIHDPAAPGKGQVLGYKARGRSHQDPLATGRGNASAQVQLAEGAYGHRRRIAEQSQADSDVDRMAK
jgi:hypothetical protein